MPGNSSTAATSAMSIGTTPATTGATSSETQVFGLAGLVGSSSVVGVGYSMGGGFGWLGRRYGFKADSVREADVVHADGGRHSSQRSC
jgi:hypothetical protein